MSSLSDEELQRLFAWVDTIPLSRAKKNINRDFSDGVLAAEVVAYYFPKLVDLHNYTPASSQKQKLANWATLNHKVLRKIKHHLAPPVIEDLVNAKPGAIEAFLHTLQYKLARHKAEKQFQQQHQHHHPHPSMGASGFTVGTCVIDGEECPAPLDASDPHIPAHAHHHAFHMHPHPHPPASSSSPSAASAFASGNGSPRRHQQFAAEGHLNSALTSPFLSSAADGNSTPASSLQMGAATERRVGGKGAKEAVRREVDEEILVEKEETIQELRETVELLEMKLAKLEQLLRLKDGKIQRLSDELARVTLGGGQGEGEERVGEGGYEEAPYV